MAEQHTGWIAQYLPRPNTASRREQLRAGVGAIVGLMLTAFMSYFLLSGKSGMAFLVAPMGASSVLLFGVPASPLAQPWSVFGGNVVSAIVGVTCAHAIDNPMLAAPLAGGLAIVCMFLMRCLHPPGGAVALTAVLAGPAVHAAGYEFAFVQVGLNTALMVLAAVVYNNLTGRRYPHSQQSSMQPLHGTRDALQTERVGFTHDDLDAVLKSYGQVLDVSRDDLEDIIVATEMKAYERRFGIITCGDIMSKDAVTLDFASELGEAWRLLRHHKLHALPVLNKGRRVIGIVAQSDFLRHSELAEYVSFAERLRRFLMSSPDTHSEKPEVVGQIMSTKVVTAKASTPIVELVPLMSNSGLHHIPILNDEQRFVGMVTQSDLLASLYESRLAEQGVAPRAA
ncbi:MAG: HPP family protein [Pseudomonadota bacterium]|nr:HPP family protein [Pseudomonadota bacterium]